MKSDCSLGLYFHRIRMLKLAALVFAIASIHACGRHGSQDARVGSPLEGGINQANSEPNVVKKVMEHETTSTSVLCDQVSGIVPAVHNLRRLTNAEYIKTIQTNLGVDVGSSLYLLSERSRGRSFTNDVSLQDSSANLLAGYDLLAQNAAAGFIASKPTASGLLKCDPEKDGIDCFKGFLERSILLFFRRPAVPAEIDALLVMTQSETGWSRIELMLRSILQSPHFLFKIEKGIAGSPGSQLIRLSPYEIASRLSFLFLGRGPDAKTLEVVAAGGFSDEVAIKKQASAMFQTTEAKQQLFDTFFMQWLNLDRLDQLTRSQEIYPEFTDELKKSMRSEVQALVSDFGWDSDSQFLTNILTAKYGYADENLAPLYESTDLSAELKKISFSAASARGGLLGTAGILAATSRNDEPSVIHRGLFVTDKLLCNYDMLAAALPMGSNNPVMTQGDESLSEAESRHSSDPLCAGCHTKIDPPGTGLQMFDAIGRHRTNDLLGNPIKTQGSFNSTALTTFSGSNELGKVLSAMSQNQNCFATQLVTYGEGSRINDFDQCVGAWINESSKDKGLESMILAYIGSKVFLYRQGD